MRSIYVVGSQTNLTELTAVLIRKRTAASTRDKAIAAIVAANPGLDLEHLRPGLVVVVPPVEGVRPPADEPVSAVADDLVQRVRDGMAAVLGAAEQAEEARLEEKKAAQELLGSAQVKRVAESVPELAANIDSVRATFKEDDAVSRRALGELREAQEVWDSDLKDLRGVAGPS